MDNPGPPTGWTVSPSGWTVRKSRASPDITACLNEPPSPGPLGKMRGQSAAVTECPANNNLLKKTFFSFIPASTFDDEKENLLDPNCAKSFPELIAYTSASSKSPKTLLIEKQEGTQLKHLPPLDSPAEKRALKDALLAAIIDMGSCRIADRGCQNILVLNTPAGFDIKMIDADRNWDNILDTNTSNIPDKEIHAANLAYLAESTVSPPRSQTTLAPLTPHHTPAPLRKTQQRPLRTRNRKRHLHLRPKPSRTRRLLRQPSPQKPKRLKSLQGSRAQ